MIEFHCIACSCSDLPTPFVEEAIFTPFYVSAPFVEYWLTKEACVYFWACYSVPLVYVSILMPVADCFHFIYLLLERKEGREKERERNIDQLPLLRPNWGPGPQPRHVP